MHTPLNHRFVGLWAALSFLLPAGAGTIHVDRDSTAATEDGSPANPYKTIAAGVAAATDGTTVRIAGSPTPYEITETITLGKGIVVSGDPSDRRAVVIDCGNKCRAFKTNHANDLICNLTVTNGYSATSGGVSDNSGYAGGILLYDNGTVSNCVVTHCTAESQGGGIAPQRWTTACPNVIDTEVCFCRAKCGQGGGGFFSCANLYVTNCFVHGNTSATGAGGILTWAYSETVGPRILGCTISNNVSETADGGGLGGERALRIRGNRFLCNRAGTMDETSKCYGGGISFCRSNHTNVLEDCTFVGNRAYRAGALYSTVKGGSGTANGLIVTNCTFVDNEAAFVGGAYLLELNPDNRHYVIDDCTFRGNHAVSYGGAGYGYGVKVKNSLFESNYVSNTSGNGGACCFGNYDVPKYESRFENCTFRGNRAHQGGALYTLGKFVAEGCTFDGNRADLQDKAGAGGAVYASRDSLGGVTNAFLSCVFTNNYAHATGGAMQFASSTPLLNVVSNCLFVGNATCMDATHNGWCGGAIADANDAKSAFLITHSVFRANRTRYDGEAIRTDTKNAGVFNEIRNCLFEEHGNAIGNTACVVAWSNLTVDACTFVKNRWSGNKPAMNVYAGAIVRNCVGWGNGQTNGLGAVTTRNDFQLLTVDSGAGVSNCCWEAMSGTGAGVANRLIAEQGCVNAWDKDLFENAAGGDYRPRTGSPLRNAGLVLTWMDAAAKDLAGSARVSGPGVDIGAYEFFYRRGLWMLVR